MTKFELIKELNGHLRPYEDYTKQELYMKLLEYKQAYKKADARARNSKVEVYKLKKIIRQNQQRGQNEQRKS